MAAITRQTGWSICFTASWKLASSTLRSVTMITLLNTASPLSSRSFTKIMGRPGNGAGLPEPARCGHTGRSCPRRSGGRRPASGLLPSIGEIAGKIRVLSSTSCPEYPQRPFLDVDKTMENPAVCIRLTDRLPEVGYRVFLVPSALISPGGLPACTGCLLSSLRPLLNGRKKVFSRPAWLPSLFQSRTWRNAPPRHA